MSLSETRLGANVTGLPRPAALPPLSAALSRRAALFGAVTVAGVSVAASTAPAASAANWLGRSAAIQSTTLSANDARLIALADAYEALDRRCHEHTAAHRHLRGEAMRAAEESFNELTAGFGPIEDEVATTPADTLAGVLAKARLCQVPTARAFSEYDHIASVADDLWRLFGAERLS